MTDLVLGAALGVENFRGLQQWMRDHDRALEIQDFVDTKGLLDNRDDLIAAWKPLLDGYGGLKGMHGPFLGLDFTNPDFELRALVTKRFLQGLDVAEALGLTHMVVHSPFTFWNQLNDRNYPFIRENMFAAAAESLAPVLKRAEEIGCVLMLENIDDSDPAARRKLVEALDSPAIRLSIDTGHAQLAHGQYKAPPVTDFIADAGALLGHVHLQDADGFADRHWHPGEGTLPWPAIFNALRRIDATPRLILEVASRTELLPQTVRNLAQCGVI